MNKSKSNKKKLSSEEREELFSALKVRFQKDMDRHKFQISPVSQEERAMEI